MTGYTKLFGSILASTIWGEPKETKILWITMLAMANKYGEVAASVPGLATMARLTLEETKAAIIALSSPDEYSRTKDFEGRRIEEIDGGWKILNHGKYRDIMSKEERREYLKLKQQEHRAKAKPVNKSSTVSTDVNSCNETSTLSTHAAPAPAPTPAPDTGKTGGMGEVTPRNAALLLFNSLPEAVRTIECRTQWEEWVDFRLSAKKVKRWDLLFKKVIKMLMPWPEAKIIECLAQSIRNGWQGVFEPRDGNNHKTARTPFNLKSIIDAKEEAAAKLKFEGFSADRWTNREAYEAYIKIIKEIRVLKDELSRLA